MKVTAKDVARQAGVSPATVSMIFNNRPGISETVRRCVLDTAAKMGYVPSKTRTNAVRILQFVVYKRHGKIISDNPFMQILMQGVSARAAELGFQTAISYFYGDKNREEQIKSVQSFQGEGILILATEMEDTDMNLFRKISVPIVLLDNYSTSMRWDAVVIDNIVGAKHAVQHLLRLGHTRIGYLHGAVEIRNFKERYNGYLKGCQRIPERLAKDAAKRIVKLDSHSEYASRAMREYLAKMPILPSAFFADNDYIAAGCCRALLEAGYHIPEDVSIIGFDDSPICQMIEPQLTTMAVPKERMGALAVSRLVERISTPNLETVRISVVPELVERGSVLQLRHPEPNDFV